MNSSIKIIVFAGILGVSFIANAQDKLISNEYLRLMPGVFCKTELEPQECLKIVSRYVAQRHIQANNDYYTELVLSRVRPLFKSHVEDPTQLYDGNLYGTLHGQIRRTVIEEVANHWLDTGELPKLE